MTLPLVHLLPAGKEGCTSWVVTMIRAFCADFHNHIGNARQSELCARAELGE